MSAYGTPLSAEDGQLATVEYVRWLLEPGTKASRDRFNPADATAASDPNMASTATLAADRTPNSAESPLDQDPTSLTAGDGGGGGGATSPDGTTTQSKPSKQISCTHCQQRKIKCDRAKPSCGHCIKSKLLPCQYRAPAPPRRGKRKATTSADEDLLVRLRKCEELLRERGVAVDGIAKEEEEDPVRGVMDVAEIVSKKQIVSPIQGNLDSSSRVVTPFRSSTSEQSGKVILEKRGSRYVESDLWRGIDVEASETNAQTFNPAIPIQDGSSAGTGDMNGEDFLFGSLGKRTSLSSLHPSIEDAGVLWRAFLENIDPLLKVLHIPTFEPQMYAAIRNPEKIDTGLEAVIFSIYTIAVVSMSEADCIKIFSAPKEKLFTRFESAAKKAFTKAEILVSTDFSLVQAYVIWLHAIRDYYHPHALWVLSGVALRIAQRAGLHREQALSNHSPFEAEMRRRAWWALMAIDFRAAELSGSGVSVFHSVHDTAIPRNLNDQDISPDMEYLPASKTGATEMIFVSLRHEVGNFFKDNLPRVQHEAGVSNFPCLTDAKIDAFEQVLEHKFLRFCDALYPLHYLTSVVGRACIGVLRLIMHHPCQEPEGGRNMTETEKRWLFQQSVKLVKYQHLIVLTPALASRYMWHCDAYFPWHAFIYMVTTICKRGDQKQAQEAWDLVEKTFEIWPKMINDIKKPLHVALGNLVIKAWDATGDWFPTAKKPGSTIPDFITKLRAQRTLKAAQPSLETSSTTTINPLATSQSYSSQLGPSIFPVPANNFQLAHGTGNDNRDYSGAIGSDIDLLSFDTFDLSPEAWAEWDKLLAGT